MKDKIKTVSKEEINLMDKGYNPERVRSDEPATATENESYSILDAVARAFHGIKPMKNLVPKSWDKS